MEANKEITLDVTLTPNDFIKYQFYHMRKFYILYFWMVVLIASLVLIIWYPLYWEIWLLFSLFFAALGNMLMAVFLRRHLLKDFNSDPVTRGEYKFRITDAGIEQKKIKSESRFEWEDIRTVYRNKDLYRLYIARKRAIVIPARFFASEEDREAFEKIVSSHVPPKENKFSASTLPLAVLFFGTGAGVIVLIATAGILLSGTMQSSDYHSGSEAREEEPAAMEPEENATSNIQSPISVDLPSSLVYSGEDDIWEVTSYGIEEKDNGFLISEGVIQMKGTDYYETDYFEAAVFIVIDREPGRLHHYELTDPGTNIATRETGWTSISYYKNDSQPATIEDIRELYAEIRWRDIQDNKIKKSRIKLYPDLTKNDPEETDEEFVQEPDETNPESETVPAQASGEESAGSPIKKGEELGSFIFASRKSPHLTNIIELREVSVAKENYESRTPVQGKGIVKVRIYYGKNGGILEEYLEYEPNGSFNADDFQVNWKNDWQAKVNVLTENGAGKKIIKESFEINVTE